MEDHDIEAVEALEPEQAAAWLLTRPESQWFDRKSYRVRPDVFARALVGFANAEGGVIALGISNGAVEDDREFQREINTLRQAVRTHCAPPVRTHFRQLDVSGPRGRTQVVLAEILPGETLHETTAGDCYLRVGDATMKLTPDQREELGYDRGASQFEARPMAGIEPDDLDPIHVAELRSAIGTRESLRHLLAARSLTALHANGVNIAGFLLLHAHPQEQMPHAHLRVIKYLDVQRGTGGSQAVAAGHDVRIEGSIPTIIRRAGDTIREWLPRRQALRPDGTFGEVPIIPEQVWLEGVVNAVVHRSYSAAGDHIRVELFPNRIEIESPGRFPGIIDPSRPLDITRYARNPRIARVCYDLGITQERGEGIRRMVEGMRSVGLNDPTYRQTSGSVRLTLAGTARLSAHLLAALPPSAAAVLSALKTAQRPLGTGEVAGRAGVTRPTALRALHALRDAGEVVWRGASPTDPRASWSLPE